jgi:hypothetical protein
MSLKAASDRGEATGLSLVASPAAKRRPEELAVLRVPEEAGVRYHDGGEGVRLRDNLSCVVEPAHMRVAGGEIAIRHRVARMFLDREEQLWHRLIEAPSVERRGAYNKERRADAGAGLRRSAPSTCSIAMSGWPAYSLRVPLMPPAREARVERQCAVEQCNHRADIFAQIGQRGGGIRQDARVVAGDFQGPPCEAGSLQAAAAGSSLRPSRRSRTRQNAAKASAGP